MTAVIGGNDGVGMPLAEWVADIDRLVAALPARASWPRRRGGVLERKNR